MKYPQYRLALFAAWSLIIPYVRASLSPSPRWGQAASIVNNRFCFQGGKTGSLGVNETTAINTNDLLLLNSIHTITTQSAPWALGPADGPTTCYHSAIPGGENNHHLIIYGGQTAGGSENDSSTSTLYYYDSVSESWTKPNIDSPPRRIEHTMVANLNTGIGYLFGGYPLTNELWSFDTNAMTWQQFSNQTFTPSPRYHHTATLLADGRMILIGGFDGNKTINMNDTYVFDTNALEWSLLNATGKIPTSRRDHAATLLPDGQSILIHGGTDKNYGVFMSDIAVLNCTLPDACVWQTLPNLNPPVGRYAHTASLIGFTAKETGDSNIYIYDLTKSVWANSYQPATSSIDSTSTFMTIATATASATTSPPVIPSTPVQTAIASDASPGTKAGAAIGGVAGVAALGALIFVFYHRRSKGRQAEGAYGTKRNSHYAGDRFSIISQSSAGGRGNRLSALFLGRNSAEPQRFSYHAGQSSRPVTMYGDYYRANRMSAISQPAASHPHTNRFSYAAGNVGTINETPGDLIGVDIGNSYFMPRRELFVVNGDADSKQSSRPPSEMSDVQYKQ
ncbi:hypothetical protein INT43_006111 [Umbelopsis isabellina]|uniref:Galactose oxidase n=1 Tax=Mortierella isabellina TaxID=91625 RepID=A0A8H7PJ57_MORIS|nr:hypothetical protein INT43_006111 [Umbelopsis isabellina]